MEELGWGWGGRGVLRPINRCRLLVAGRSRALDAGLALGFAVRWPAWGGYGWKVLWLGAE